MLVEFYLRFEYLTIFQCFMIQKQASGADYAQLRQRGNNTLLDRSLGIFLLLLYLILSKLNVR